MPDVTVEVEVYCAGCGTGLCNDTESTFTHNRHRPCFRVQPCTHCLQKARDEGFQEGHDKAREEAREEAADGE